MLLRNVIIKVDNSTSGVGNPTYGRPSVKLLSNDTIGPGSLLIFDAIHLPFGCSVWPAFWTQGSNWPDDGEIDIVENVNLATNNQYALHTTQGCQHPPQGAVQESGTLQQADCFNATNGNTGCLIRETQSNSFGQGFATNGGGAWAMLWTDEALTIWFFPRSAIPSDLPTANPNPSSWPEPSAVYPASSCDFSKFFGPQTIIFDITICGNFAGLPSVFNPSCTGTCTSLVQDPSNFGTAYFEIRYMTVFTNSSTGFASSTAAAIGTSPTASNPSASGSGSSGSSNAIGFSLQSSIALLVIAVTLVGSSCLLLW